MTDKTKGKLRLKGITRQELKVIGFILSAMPSKEIAKEMNLKEDTVKSYLNKIYSCLGLKSRHQLIVYCAKLGAE